MPIDLTPFGFTPTESQVYQVLLTRGPSTGYAVASEASVARANAYHALDGLTSKGAAELVETDPKKYRAVAPNALLALITQQEALKVERLEEQLAQLDQAGAPSRVEISGDRALVRLATRISVRSANTVRCIAPPWVLDGLDPAWRARNSKGLETEVWTSAEAGWEGSVALEGTIDSAKLSGLGADACLVETDDSCIVAEATQGETTGIWSSERLWRALVSASISFLTQ